MRKAKQKSKPVEQVREGLQGNDGEKTPTDGVRRRGEGRGARTVGITEIGRRGKWGAK